MTEIVKVQRSLNTTVEDETWLVYAKGRDRMQHVPLVLMASQVIRDMRGDNIAFFDAEWSGKGWQIGARRKSRENW